MKLFSLRSFETLSRIFFRLLQLSLQEDASEIPKWSFADDLKMREYFQSLDVIQLWHLDS